MRDNMETTITYNDLTNLELKIDHLLVDRTKLVSENQSLRQQLSKTTQERAQLADKNKRVFIRPHKIRHKYIAPYCADSEGLGGLLSRL